MWGEKTLRRNVETTFLLMSLVRVNNRHQFNTCELPKNINKILFGYKQIGQVRWIGKGEKFWQSSGEARIS